MAGRTRRARACIAVDAAMGILFVAVMSTALVQEAPHEYLGIALFASIAAHVVLNRRWFATIFRGRHSPTRVLQAIAVIGLLACMAGQVVSSLVLSRYALGFLPALPGAAIARRLHMSCAYWSFVFAFAHAGLQLKGFGRRVRASGSGGTPRVSRFAVWAARIVFLAMASYGIASFIQLDVGAYLLLQVEFAFVDYSVPVAVMFVRYASIGVLIAGAFHYLRRAVDQIARKND